MAELLSFLVLLISGLVLSEVFRRFHMPYVVFLIIAGILVGPFVLNIFTIDPTIAFFGSIGLIFLMFMAGLEIKISGLGDLRGVFKIAIINGLFPFVVGFLIATYFGYDFVASVLLGTIFVSSSIAVVVPSLESNEMLETRVGKTIVASTMFEDILSLIMLSVILQTVNPTSTLPLPIFYISIFLIMVVLKILIPGIRKHLFTPLRTEKDMYEQEMRIVFAILIGTVVFFELLGVHSIIAGFFAGLVLSESFHSELFKKKLHAISYGIFIPAFFIIVGAETDITLLQDINGVLFLTVAIVFGSIIAKVVSGYIGGRWSNFTPTESLLVGFSTTPQLSTTLAVAFVGFELGLLDQQIITAMVALSVITTFIGPLAMNRLIKRIRYGSYV